MEGKKEYKRWLDIMRVTGKFEKDGKERNRYHKIGSVVSSPHHNNMFMVLDSLPNAGERLALFVNDNWQEPDDQQKEADF